MYAKVIVDIPARPVDRPFDYVIPERLQGVAAVGSRVSVTFGGRTVQGFITELNNSTDIAPGKLKPIDDVLDLTPPLTEELVDLAKWMSKQYLCTELAALQAMVPGALKAKYERHIQCAPSRHTDEAAGQHALLLPEHERILNFVRQRDTVEINALLRAFPEETAVIKQLLDEGQLLETTAVKDKLKVKTMLMVYPPEPLAKLEEALGLLPARANKQAEVIKRLQAVPEPVPLASLLTELSISAGTVKSLAEKGWLRLEESEVQRDPYGSRSFRRTDPLPLTPEQEQVFGSIRGAVDAEKHQVFLLQGVTGSGKTEVYLQSIQACLDRGKEAIVLVPEISLTPQMVERFKGRFGDEVAVLHSRLSHGERYDEWRKIARKEVRVVIGARSAIFAPFTRLGIIIIDEEHESSYKQEESPKYHARDAAVKRGQSHQAVVLLGSATPSLESIYMTKREAQAPFELLAMQARVEGRPLPKVNIIDMREELRAGNRSMFSRPLYKALEERLERKEQAVLLLNRRGYATFVMCRSCGYTAQCPHCDISLTYHQTSHSMRCHYCGYADREPKVCPDCSSEHIRHFGTGTQRVEEELSKLLPGIRVIRMDVDTTSQKGAHEKWLTMFANRQADVLLGTQMVAKGLDFPHVTLVGALAADSVLHLPDFRAAERTFQLLTQVAGRAGRHQLPGEVFVQTYAPEHYSIISAGKHDYTSFMQRELMIRSVHNYPPYCRLILMTLSHEQVPLLIRSGEQLAQRLKELAGQMQQADRSLYIEVLGPAASPLSRIKDRYRFQCMVKYRGNTDVIGAVAEASSVLNDVVKERGLRISVDVDPQYLM